METRSLILSVLLSVVPILGSAQEDRFRAIDRNGDGFISSDEWYGQRGVAPVPFTVVDLNGDGRISEAEFREWSAARGDAKTVGMTSADRFRAIDKNKDGFLSPEEWKDGSYSRTPFATVDTNKDGKISLQEFAAWDSHRPEPVGAAPPPLPGTEAPAMSERLHNLDRGAGGAAGSSHAIQSGPRPASGPAPAPPFSATTTTPSGGIPGSSPSMNTGSGLTTR